MYVICGNSKFAILFEQTTYTSIEFIALHDILCFPDPFWVFCSSIFGTRKYFARFFLCEEKKLLRFVRWSPPINPSSDGAKTRRTRVENRRPTAVSPRAHSPALLVTREALHGSDFTKTTDSVQTSFHRFNHRLSAHPRARFNGTANYGESYFLSVSLIRISINFYTVLIIRHRSKDRQKNVNCLIVIIN